MSTKSKEHSIAQEILFILPWWMGPIVIALTYLAVRYMPPVLAQMSDRPLFTAGGTILPQFAPLIALLLTILWIVTLGQKYHRRQLLIRSKGIDEVRNLRWQDFELLVGEYYRQLGYHVEESGGGGADGGIDLIARRGGESCLIQCKNWKAWKVGAPVVREMLGVVTAERASRGAIVTSGEFTKPARDFAADKPLDLIGGDALVQMIAKARDGLRQRGSDSDTGGTSNPDAVVAAADQIPLCPICSADMILRKAKRGPNSGSSFWGCSGYPQCKGTRPA